MVSNKLDVAEGCLAGAGFEALKKLQKVFTPPKISCHDTDARMIQEKIQIPACIREERT
jgi:hypothetical protein